MAPISDNEIAFFRFGHPPSVNINYGAIIPETPGGVAIYNIETDTVTDVASTVGFAFVS